MQCGVFPNVRLRSIAQVASAHKERQLHVIPLGVVAASELGRRRLSKALYFPARGKTTPYTGFSKRYELDELRGIYDWMLHDLKRTFASGLAAIGVQLPVIKRLLNHVSGSFGGIVVVYQRYDFMTEMRDAIKLWEVKVSRILVEDEADTTPPVDSTGNCRQEVVTAEAHPETRRGYLKD